ncbi:helix-turn-helix domain-containing protein, partial [Endozoicomonas sp. SM1973]
LAEFANTENKCWPSIQTIGDISGASRSSVKRCIKILKELDLIDYFWRKCKNGKENTSNIYVLKIDQSSPEKTEPGWVQFFLVKIDLFLAHKYLMCFLCRIVFRWTQRQKR